MVIWHLRNFIIIGPTKEALSYYKVLVICRSRETRSIPKALLSPLCSRTRYKSTRKNSGTLDRLIQDFVTVSKYKEVHFFYWLIHTTYTRKAPTKFKPWGKNSIFKYNIIPIIFQKNTYNFREAWLLMHYLASNFSFENYVCFHKKPKKLMPLEDYFTNGIIFYI